MSKPNGEGEQVVLSITLQPNGQVSVHGPIQNKLLCYGLLGVAAEILQKLNPAEKKPDIVIPKLHIVPT